MKVAILGGGVAGLCCGIALRQRGIDVEIYERAVSPKTIGAGVVLWPNATLILNQLGLLQNIKAYSGTPKEMRRVSSSGHALGSLDIGIIDKQMGCPSLSISRRMLIDILLRAFKKAGGHLHYNHQVIEILSNSDAARASIKFQSGLIITPEVIIGAEGRMNSPSRSFVLGNNKPVFQNFINWVGILESSQSVINDTVVYDFWGVGARFGIVPLLATSAYWAAGVTAKEVSANRLEHYKEELLEVFSHWPAPVLHLIQGTPNDCVNKIYVHDHDPIETWHRENLILVGDAAHAPLPTSGQGACQAIEDAWHIAEALSQGAFTPQRAFRNFTDIRRERTKNIILAGRKFAQVVLNDNPDFCRARDESSKLEDFSRLAESMADGWLSESF